MYIIVWEYVVSAGQEAEFEKIYGAEGDWVQLFEQADGYLGTALVCDTPGHYITVDHWASSETYESFHKKYHAAYKALDVRCSSLSEKETLIGMGTVFRST